jgi:hypothetical protein
LPILLLTFDPQSDGNDIKKSREDPNDQFPAHPPTFSQSEFETIVRRQKTNPHGLKIMNIPSCFPSHNNAVRILDLGFLSLCHSSIGAGLRTRCGIWNLIELIWKMPREMASVPARLGQFRASSVAANAVIDSVF